MKKQLINILKFLFFLAIGLSLFYLVYSGDENDWSEIWRETKKANYWWISLSLILSLLSHWLRTLRWIILIEPLNYKPSKLNTFFAVLVMYLANIAVPRMGEVTRCGIVKRYEKVPFTKLLGTVFVERAVDLVVLLFLAVVVFFTQMPTIIDFMNNNPNIANRLNNMHLQAAFFWFLVFAVLVVIAFFIFRKKLEKISWYIKLKDLIISFLDGLKSVFKLKKNKLFIFYTLSMWLVYFMMIYVGFLAFESTMHLSLTVGLTVFVMSSFGMVAPVQGGIGAWHFMVIETLLIYGIALNDAKIFALVVHGSMTLFLVFAGFVSLILLPLFNKKNIPDNAI